MQHMFCQSTVMNNNISKKALVVLTSYKQETTGELLQEHNTLRGEKSQLLHCTGQHLPHIHATEVITNPGSEKL